MSHLIRRLFDVNRRETRHYPGILVPLHEAHLHVHRKSQDVKSQDIAADSPSLEHVYFEDDQDGDSNDLDIHTADGRPRDETRVMLPMTSVEYTIESLRRQMRQGGKLPGRRWTQYESAHSVSHGSHTQNV